MADRRPVLLWRFCIRSMNMWLRWATEAQLMLSMLVILDVGRVW